MGRRDFRVVGSWRVRREGRVFDVSCLVIYFLGFVLFFGFVGGDCYLFVGVVGLGGEVIVRGWLFFIRGFLLV